MKDIKIYAFADEAATAVDGQIEAMKRNGLCGLEIRGVDGENISDIAPEKAREVRAKLDANGLETWSIGSPIGKIRIDAPFEEHLEKFKRTLCLADILGAKNIRMFSFFIPKEIKPDDCKNEVIERVGEFLRVAAGSKITLCHENEKGIFGDVPERCLLLHKTFPELKGVFDPANFVQCGVDTLAAWEQLKPYVHYMHIKDCRKDGMIVPAGLGDGNIKQLAENYISAGGRVFTMEPHLKVFEGFAALENPDDKTLIPEYEYSDSNEAFDIACRAFRALIDNI